MIKKKYIINKADGSQVSSEAEYFVLRLDKNQPCQNHRDACRKAILAYADAIEETIPSLAKDIEKNMEHKVKKVLILEYSLLPEDIQNAFSDKWNAFFHNDIILPIRSEFEPNYPKETWADTLTKFDFEEYFEEQKSNGCKSKTLEEFIKEYGLDLEYYLFKNKEQFDLEVEDILINICW